MRLIHRQRHSQRSKAPRISISQAEITADLLYPASPRAARQRVPASSRRVAPVSARGDRHGARGHRRRTPPKPSPRPTPNRPATRTLVWQDPVPTAAAGATMTGMEYMEAIVAGEMPPPPIAVTMRMRPIELERGPGRLRGRARARSTTTRSASSTAATPRPCSTRRSAAPCTRPCRPASATPRSASRPSTCARSPATPAASSARPTSSTAAAARPPPRPSSPRPRAASCSPTASPPA